MNNDDLKPFGYIQGTNDVKCVKCGQTWALLAPEATCCKRCARAALKATTEEIDAAVKLNQDREIVLDDMLEK